MESGNVMKWPELTPAETYVDILDTIDYRPFAKLAQ